MSSQETSAAPDPSSVAQEVAAAQSASAEREVASQDGPSTTGLTEGPLTEAPVPAESGDFGLLEVDTDRDSAYGGDDSESFTTSINSTVTDYTFENGRRYHAHSDGKYALPNDDAEINRLELQHRIWQISLDGRLNLAPIPANVKTALDIGCGTGAWAIEFAEAHPNCKVIGTDLSPIQPTLVPPNVEFLVDDITSPWLYDHRFQYIHSRAITIGIKDWAQLVDECWTNLEPGGWVEFQEYHAPFTSDDGTIARGPAFSRWMDGLMEATGKAGTKLDAILGVPPILKERGFVNLGDARTKWPLGPWAKGKRGKKVGRLLEEDVCSGLEGLSLRLFTKVLGMKDEDVRKLVKEAEEDIKTKKMHVYMPIDFFWAQKPPNA